MDASEGPKQKAEPSRTAWKGQKERHDLHGHLGRTNMKGRAFMDTLESKIEKDNLGWPKRTSQKGSSWTAEIKKDDLGWPRGGANEKAFTDTLEK